MTEKSRAKANFPESREHNLQLKLAQILHNGPKIQYQMHMKKDGN
jgi:hypothetical protein